MTGNEIKDSFDLLSGSLNRILRHRLDVRKRCARVGVGRGVFTCVESLTEAGQSGSGTSSRVTRLLYTSMTRKPSSSLQSGFSPVGQPIRGNSRYREALPIR